GNKEVVQAAAARQTDLKRGVEDAGRALEQAARMINRDGLHELLRAQAAPTLEEFLAVGGAQAQMFGQAIERGLLGPGCRQKGNGTPDELIIASAIGGERDWGRGGGGCLQHGSFTRGC